MSALLLPGPAGAVRGGGQVRSTQEHTVLAGNLITAVAVFLARI